MPAKLTLEHCKKLAKEKNGKCLSNKYKNSITKMKWQCHRGHEWQACVQSIKYNNTWCSFCAGNNKLTLEHCKEIARNKGGECLSIYYKNTKTKMKWKCDKGHIWETCFDKIKNRNTWCPNCAGKIKLTLEECKKYAVKKGGKCLSVEYKNNTTKMKWKCNKGHIWKTTFQIIKNLNSWCPSCSGCKKLTLQDCKKYAQKREGKCLEKIYKNCTTKMKWRCSQGHEWKSCFANIKNLKRWCPHCQKCPKCMLWKTNGRICRYCKSPAQNRLYRKSKEFATIQYLKKNLPDHDFIDDGKSIGNHCHKKDKNEKNGHLYPDVRIEFNHYNLIIEIDEFEHRGASYKCDEQRMYNIIANMGIPCVFIRYNPDNKKSNLEFLLQTVKKYLDLNINQKLWDDHGFKVEYLFYKKK